MQRTQTSNGKAPRRGLVNRVILALLRSPLRRTLDSSVLGLRYTSSYGNEITLPVEYVAAGKNLIAAPSRTPAPARSGDAQLWRSWTGWVTLGEFAGFSVPATVGAVTVAIPAGFSAPLLVAAGAVEGALLGLAQAHVLRRAVPTVNWARWAAATAVGAALAWMIGLLPMLTDGRLFELPIPIIVPLAVVLGTVLLGSIGTAQWLVLRHQVDRSRWWIVTTAGAWIVGLIVFTAVTTPLWQPGQSVILLAGIGALGGLLMAGTVAGLTGWGMVRLRRQQSAVRSVVSTGQKTCNS